MTGGGCGRQSRPFQQQRHRATEALGATSGDVQPDALVDGVGGGLDGRCGRAGTVHLRQARGALGQSPQELECQRLVGAPQRHVGCLPQEVQVVRLLVGESPQRSHQSVAPTRPLEVRALSQRRHVSGLGAERPRQRGVGRDRVLAVG